MSRYIDADALIKWINGTECFMDVFKRVTTDIINKQPTVDAVQVVRCRDCLWRHDDSSPMWLPCMERKTPNDWFCADGERKNNETKLKGE